MGLNFFASEDSASNIQSPNPNPYLFLELNKEVIGDYSIIEALYLGCTTFDGRKLMLVKNSESIVSRLDPHLLGDGHPVIARFEPNEKGWRMAKMCALYLKEFNL